MLENDSKEDAQMKTTKRSMLVSGLCLLLTAVMLMGSTFAWFTDSVTNTGNVITAGNLSIDAFAYDVGTGGTTVTIEGVNGSQPITFEADGQDLKTVTTPILNGEMDWEPGMSNAKLLTVTNSGSLAANIRLSFAVTDGGLQDALWFDFVRVDENGNVQGQFEKRPMSTLNQLAEAMVMTLKPNDTLRFVLVYGMYESAGNQFQAKTFSADVAILATQAPVEADGFGKDDYDKEAAFSAVSNDTFVESMEKGGVTAVDSSFVWDENITLNGTTNSVLELNPETVVTVTKDGIFDLYGSSALTIRGEGTLEQDMESEIGYLVRAAGDSKVVIEGGTFIGGLTCIQAGDNAQVEIYGGHFEALVDWNETYWLLNLIDNSNASIKVYGGTFVNFDPSNSKTENPVANFVAEGYKVVSETQDNGDIWYTVVPE